MSIAIKAQSDGGSTLVSKWISNIVLSAPKHYMGVTAMGIVSEPSRSAW
jgi:hypothetical protein